MPAVHIAHWTFRVFDSGELAHLIRKETAAAGYFPRYRSASTTNEKAGEGWRRLG
jgi:hypothetical protein